MLLLVKQQKMDNRLELSFEYSVSVSSAGPWGGLMSSSITDVEMLSTVDVKRSIQ